MEKKETQNLSKLDLKNMIAKIIEEAETEVYKCLEKSL